MNGDRGEGPPGIGYLDSEPALSRRRAHFRPLTSMVTGRHDGMHSRVPFVAALRSADERELLAVELDQRPMTSSPRFTLEWDEDAL